MPNQNLTESWKEGFKQQFGSSEDSLDENFNPIFTFIENLLLSQRERLRKAVDDFSEGEAYVYVHDLLKYLDRTP